MSSENFTPPTKLRYSGAAVLTTFSLSHLRHLVSAKKIPFIKVGRTVLFDALALEEWLQEKSVQPFGDE